MRSISSNVARQIALPTLVAGMELVCVYLYLGWLSKLGFPALHHSTLSLPAAILVMAVALAVVRPLLRRTTRDRTVSLIALAAGLITVAGVVWLSYSHPAPSWSDLIALPDRLGNAGQADTALVAGAVLWWRGVVIAREPLHFDDIEARLTIGAVIVAVALVLAGITGSTLTPAWSTALSLIFFGCALPALALTRLEDVRSEAAVGGAETGFSREWLGVLGLIVAGILAAAVVAAALVALDVRRPLLAALNLAANGLFLVAYILIWPVALVVAVLVYAGRALVALLTGGKTAPPPAPTSPSDALQRAAHSSSGGLSPALVATGKWALLILVVAIVALIVVRAVFRYQRSRAAEVEELHESIWPGGSLLRALLHWLRRLLHRLRPTSAAPPAGSAQWEPQALTPETRSVRALYRRWLAAAAARGRARAPGETADEFQIPGTELLPAAAESIAGLTRAYDVARYDGAGADTRTLAAANTAWDHVQAAIDAAAAKEEMRRGR